MAKSKKSSLIDNPVIENNITEKVEQPIESEVMKRFKEVEQSLPKDEPKKIQYRCVVVWLSPNKRFALVKAIEKKDHPHDTNFAGKMHVSDPEKVHIGQSWDHFGFAKLVEKDFKDKKTGKMKTDKWLKLS